MAPWQGWWRNDNPLTLSLEEGLDQDSNSFDAQRETDESYISSQWQESWIALPDRYDDGRFTSGNMERAALTRLIAERSLAPRFFVRGTEARQ